MPDPVYSQSSSYVKNKNPLSTYHRPSETACSSYIQNGDRLSLTYHLIYHLSPSIKIESTGEKVAKAKILFLTEKQSVSLNETIGFKTLKL